MRRYSRSNVKIDWRDDEVMADIGNIVDGVVKTATDMVVAKARSNLSRAGAVDTGRLSDQIEIKASKYKHGGYAVVAQPRESWRPRHRSDDVPYALFIELGGHYSLWGKYSVKQGNNKEGPHFEGRPYMRPAIRYLKRKFRKMLQEALGSNK